MRLGLRVSDPEEGFARLESSLTRSFVTWLLASQATVVAAIGLLVAFR